MHVSSLRRMAWFAERWLADGRPRSVLDVGSCDVNGCYRPLFPPPRFAYTGLDMEAGPNVDIVPSRPYCWDMLADDAYDVIISGQAFEHMEFFWLTMAEMARVLRPGGLLCVIAPRGFPRHRYPVDCYRFDADGMVALARWANLTPLHASTNLAPDPADRDWYSTECADSMLIAQKPEAWPGLLEPRGYTFVAPDLNALAGGLAPPASEEENIGVARAEERASGKQPSPPLIRSLGAVIKRFFRSAR